MVKNRTQYRNNIRYQAVAADNPNPLYVGRKILLFILVFIILLLLLSDFGFGESPITYDFNRIISIPHPLTSLLRDEHVRQELGMSTAQIIDVERVIDDFDLPLWRLRDLPVQQRNEEADFLIRQLQEKISKILSQRQIERLNQLKWQAIGVDAVLEPEVALKLSLSGEQINKIRILLNVTYDKLATLHRNMVINSESLKISYKKKIREETERNVISVLNSRQQSRLSLLMGRPFDLSQVRIVACKAPELEVDTWINKPKVTLSELKGKVTVVHFYAFGCGNCIRTLPYYNQWRDHFPSSSFQIIGIHRPETQQERDIEKVKKKAEEAGMEYPVAVDNESLMWNAWGNCVWPSIYLIDKNGYVRYWWYGELNWQGAESEKYLRGRIQELINES